MAQKGQSKKGIKDKVKKAVPNNQWFINVGKSMGFASMDLVKNLMPDTADSIDWNKSVVISTADMIQDIRKNHGIRNMFNKQLDNLPQVKAARQIQENALADLKSGNLYNRNRELGLNDSGEFDFGADFSFDDDPGFSFIEDDGSGDTGSDAPPEGGGSRPPVTVINTMPLAKTIAASTEVNVSTMVAIADQNMAMETEKIMLNKQTFEATMGALNSINDNLALLVQFNSDSTAKYQAAALKYFEESINAMKKPAEEEKKEQNLWNPFTAGGGLKLDEYAQIVKENLGDIKDNSMVLSGIVDLLANPDVISAFAKNPLGTLMTMAAEKMIPGALKSSLGKLDKNLNSVLPAVLARINSFEGSDDEILNFLNKTFGYKYKAAKTVDLGAYEKGAISWDGESKKALVEVIPSYLRRIESVLTGTEERIYNYSTGKFTDIDNIQKYYNDKMEDAQTSGFYGVRSEIDKVVSELGLSTAARKQFDEDIKEYFKAITERGYLINPFDKTDKHGNVTNEMSQAGLFDYDPNREALVKRVLGQLPKSVLKEMGTTAITDSRERVYKLREEDIANPNLTGYAYLHNDLDKNGKMRYNKKFIGEEKKDRFGLSQLDYLRDIRSALINGIKVFPDHRRRYTTGGRPNEGILQRERQENEDYERRRREEQEAERLKREREAANAPSSTNGISINDAVNISNEKWKRIYKSDDNASDNRLVNHINNLNDKLDDAIYDILFGDFDYREAAADKLGKYVKKGKSMIDSMQGFFGDTVKAFKSYFTGQDYITSDGILVKGNEDNMLNKIKGFFTGVRDKFAVKDVENGLLGGFAKDFMEGYRKFKISLFGEKSESKNKGQDTIKSLMSKISQRLPKAVGYGYMGALAKTMFAPHLGILGNFLMPGGPLAAVLGGTAFGLLKQSETFNRFMFGEQDENGERVGGIISKAWQNKYEENKAAIKKGMTIGLLGSLFLPGGPVAGAVMGIGASLTARNEAFQEFLYGKDYKTQDKKSMMNGAFGKALKRLTGAGSGEDGDPQLAKFLGTAGLGVGIAQGIGLLPSFLLPGGPVMGAMLGLAGGIAASSNKFQEMLLGEKDVDGKRYGGLLTQLTNWFSTSFMEPLKIKATAISDFIYGFTRKHLFDPIARSFEPMLYAVKNMALDLKDGIIGAFTKVTSPIVESFKEHVTRPLGKILKNVLINPLKKLLGGTFKLIGKTLLGIAALPFKGIGAMGAVAEKYNERSVLRRERRRRGKEYDKNTDKENWNKRDRKRAMKMTKDEEKAVLDEQLKYREGKSRKERAKEQKEQLKEEMTKRKERREEMQRQYEEDKAFGKSTKWKYASKKQKERREQELKEKEAWLREQQTMHAQETNEKVGKISENTSQLTEQQEKVTTKLDDFKNTVKEGFESLKDAFTRNIRGSGYGNVTDHEIGQIHDYLDGKPVRQDPTDGTINPDRATDPSLKEKIKELNEKLNRRKVINEKLESKDKGKVISINRKLQDNNQSHKEGLDEVPKDGYLAELHEGEMVVPKKPAKKLRNMMGGMGNAIGGLANLFGSMVNAVSKKDKRDRGDNALGLSDDEADRLEELEARQRRDSIVNKAGRGLNKVKDGALILGARGAAAGLRGVAAGLRGTANVLNFGVESLGTAGRLIDTGVRGAGNLLDTGIRGIGNGIVNGVEGAGNLINKGVDAVGTGMHNAGQFMKDSILGIGNKVNGGIGAIAGMFGKSKAEDREIEDDALGLTEDEEDRLKELDDRARYDHASRKDVDFIQDQIAAEEKEKADKSWKDKLLNAVQNLGGLVASAGNAGMNIFDKLGEGLGNISGLLGGLAIPTLLQLLMKGANDYQESEEYIQSRTDKNGEIVTDNYDLVRLRTNISARNLLWKKPIKLIKKKLIDPAVNFGKAVYKTGKNIFEGTKNTGKKMIQGTKNVGNAIYNSNLGQKFLKPVGDKIGGVVNKGKEFLQPVGDAINKGKSFLFGNKSTADNVVDFASAKAAKEGAESATKSTLKGTGKVINIADAKIAKDAAESGSGKVLKKAMGGATDNGGLISKLIEFGKKALNEIGEYAAEKFPKIAKIGSKLIGMADNIFKSILKFGDNILLKFAKKITGTIAKVAAGVSSGFTLDVVFAVGDLATGLTAGNAGNLFGVSTENVDARMRIISSIMQAVFNFNFMAIISLINEITNMFFNFNFLRNIAIWLYNLTGGKNDFSSRITSKQIDACKSIDEALSIMGITDPNDIAMLKDGDNWKDFAGLDNKEFGGVISATEQIELARLQYNLENGTTLSSQAFIDMESKTFGTKVMEWGKKLFTTEASQVKYNKYTNKAAEHAAKAEESTGIAKWYHNWRANANQNKAEKTMTKAAEKKAKAETKAAEHAAKAETSTGIAKWYHNWRAEANQKKVKKYTMGDDGTVQEIPEEAIATDTSTSSTTPTVEPSTESMITQYSDLAEGEIYEDENGNRYNHLGELVYAADASILGMTGDAGMGEGVQDGSGKKSGVWGKIGKGLLNVLFPHATIAKSGLNLYNSVKGASDEEKAGMKNTLGKVGKGLLTALFPQAATIKMGMNLFNKSKNKKVAKTGMTGDAGKGEELNELVNSTGNPLDSLVDKNRKPDEYVMLPIMNENGDVVSYQAHLKKDSTEIEGFGTEDTYVQPNKNMEVIPQVDEKGNVLSYTTVEKNKKTGLFSRLSATVGSLFGGNSSTNSSSVDNSSSVTNNTGDTYNTNTTEIDTSMFGTLTEAINKLVDSNGNNNIDEEGNVKTGGILAAIVDPIGYLTKKLTNYGVDLYESKTGKEADLEKVNQGIAIFNMLRDPFGFLYSSVKNEMDPDGDGKKDKTFKEVISTNYEEGKEKLKDWTEQGKKWTDEKLNQGKEWADTKITQGKEWANTKLNQGKEWITGKYNQGLGWLDHQYDLSDDVADTIMGNNKAEANMLTTGIAMSSKLTTKIWNAFVGEEDELREKDVQNFVSTIIHDALVAPFQKHTDAFLEKKEELETKVGDWVNGAKDSIVDGFDKYIKEPFKDYCKEEKKKFNERKKKQEEWIKNAKNSITDGWNDYIKEPFLDYWKKEKAKFDERKKKQEEWINEAKNNISDGFNQYIKEPFTKWYNTNKPKMDEALKGAKDWIGGIKDKIVEGFNKYIKDPVSDALSPVTTAISDGWNGLKNAFAPIANLFIAIKEGDLSAIKDIIQGVGDRGSQNANAEADNDGILGRGSSNTKPLDQQLKPKNYIFNSTENAYEDNKPNQATSGLKDRGNTHNFPFYSQADNRWGNEKLIGGRSMGDSGCGPTASAMVLTHLTGQHITPDTMAKAGKEYLPGYTSYNYFPQIANKFRLNYSEANDAQSLKARLAAGQPVILSGFDSSRTSATPYTEEGHIVVATGLDGNNVQINDPRGPSYSGSYSLSSVMKGLKRGIVLSSTKETEGVGLPTSGLYSLTNDMTGKYTLNEDLPSDEGVNESLGGDAGQIKLWEKVVGYAKAFERKLQYSFGSKAIDKNGMTTDCSGFTKHVMDRCGVKISAGSANQRNDGVGVDPSQAQAGDLVVWNGHVGLVIDSNKNMIDAGSDDVPKIRSYESSYWKSRGKYVIRRVIDPNKMVSAKVDNYHTGIGFSGIVGSQGGGDLNGGGGTPSGPQASLDKVLLIGDSLTVGMKPVLEGKYPNAHAMGKGGKWAKHWLQSLGELPAADQVSTVIQWLGINGVHANESNMKDSQTLLTKLKEKYPNTPIFNMKIFPTTQAYGYNGYKGEWWKGLSEEFNNGMASWAGSNGVTQLDATQGFIQSDGYLDPSKAVDGIHFTTDGYKGVLSNIESGIGSYNSSNTGAPTGGTAAAPAIDEMGVFGKLKNIGTAMIASIYNGKDMFDAILNPTTAAAPTDGTTPTTGTTPDISNESDTATAVWKFFTGKGYSSHATAGIMGNLQQESGMDPTKKQYGGGPGRGIAQWTVSEERFKGLQSHAQSKGKDWTDLQSQLEWIDLELGGKDRTTANKLKAYGGLDGFKKASDYKWAVKAFERSFERAGDPRYENRYKYAQQYFDKLSSAGSGGFEIPMEKTAGGGFTMATSAEAAPSSGIPTSMNGWAYYQQTDPQWQENIDGRKIGPSGCGMASHAMMLTTIFGKKVTPVTVGKFAKANGHWPSGMSWGLPKAIAEKTGLKIVKTEQQDGGLPASALENLKAQIKAGYPAILSGVGQSSNMNTPFTTSGHIVLAVGVDGNGNVIINDPRAPKYTKAYGDDGMLNIGRGLRAYWAFDNPGGASLPADWSSGDFTSTGGTPTDGTTPTTGGTTATAAPTIDELGPFSKLKNIGTALIASIYNGKDMFDAILNPAAATTTTDGTTPSTGGTTPTGDASYNGTKYDLSVYNMDGLSDKKKSHINKMIHGTLHTYKTHGLFPSVTFAQSVQESGWGLTSGLATEGKAAFGIKADKSWTGKVYNGKTFEYGANGKYNTTAGFRAYNSIDESIIDRANFLKANSRYTKAGVFSATSAEAQARALQSAGYATDPNYASGLISLMNGSNLQRFDTPKPPKEASAGNGDGNTYLVSPRGDAGKGGERVSYTKSVTSNSGMNTTDVNAQRNLEAINRKINVAVNNINAADPTAYTEILKLIMQELQAINNNTAATATGVKNIEIVSANAPINGNTREATTADVYKSGQMKKDVSRLQTINSSTGYHTARQIAGYKK